MFTSCPCVKTKVWVGYEASFDGGMGIYRHLERVFSCEVAAFLWAEEKQANDYEWREFEEREVTCLHQLS